MRYKEAMPPTKKMVKPAKRVKQRKYAEDLEEYEGKKGKLEDNKPARKPEDIAGALNRAKEGYSKKPRVKPSKKKQR